MTLRYLCRSKWGHNGQCACVANDRLWEYVSNERLTRQHRHLFSCRPSSFFFIFNFCVLSIFLSLSRNQTPEQIFSDVYCSFFCLSCIYSGEAVVILFYLVSFSCSCNIRFLVLAFFAFLGIFVFFK
ncbi:hypothetical protein ACOSQ2_030900 [Xanthoceras sorbifolium]